jgi:hypothetical protein
MSQPVDSPEGEADGQVRDIPQPPGEGPQSAFTRAEPSPPARRSGRAALWLAVLALVVVAGIAASPFWAPFVAPLLPWGRQPADREQRLAARLAALAEESAAARLALARTQSQQSAALRRLDDEAAAIAALKAGFADLGRRLDGVAAQAAARPAVDAAAVQRLQQEVAELGKRAGDLAGRVAALEAHMAALARPPNETPALILALLEMREKIDAAQPFTAQYAAFLALAQQRPDLLAAARPLAALAQSGVASRAALARDLAHLARTAASARPAAASPPGGGGWSALVLEQLRRLVTIRRISGDRQTPLEASVAQAEADLARGDLGAAVTRLQALPGPSAEAVRPWLEAARRRLSAETALLRLQRMLVTRSLQHAMPAAPAAGPEPGARAPDREPGPARPQGRSGP